MYSDTSYQDINSEIREKIKNDFLKPLHNYAYIVVPKPEKISNNRYRQTCYSEYAIFFEKDNKINMVSRPATQQFKSIENPGYPIPENCFSNLFAWYCAWFIDIDAQINFVEPDVEDYAFCIPEKFSVNFKEKYKEPRIKLEPIWVPFFVKKDSKYIKSTYGKIERLIPAYDMVIK